MAAPSKLEGLAVELQVAELDLARALTDARSEPGQLQGPQSVPHESDQSLPARRIPMPTARVQVPDLDPDPQREPRAGDDALDLARMKGGAGLAIDHVLGFQLGLPAGQARGVADEDA